MRRRTRRDRRRIRAVGEQSDRPWLLLGRPPQVFDGIAAGTVDADDDDVRLQRRDARQQIVSALQALEQHVTCIPQPRFDDLGAGRIVIDQKDGQGLGHGV